MVIVDGLTINNKYIAYPIIPMHISDDDNNDNEAKKLCVNIVNG